MVVVENGAPFMIIFLRFVGKPRDWVILNSVWSNNRIGILSSTWHTHDIVNFTGPLCSSKLKDGILKNSHGRNT